MNKVRPVVAKLSAGCEEPCESRDSRTDLWGTGGEIRPVYPTLSRTSSNNLFRLLQQGVVSVIKEKRGIESITNSFLNRLARTTNYFFNSSFTAIPIFSRV